MRTEQDLNQTIDCYADMVQRICMVHLKNQADTEDIFQTVFLRYMTSSLVFENEAHKKAWLIKVTRNACKDLLKSFFQRRTVSLDELGEQPALMKEEHREILEAVLSLPKKYREVVYLHYYEGYTAPQLSQLLGKNVNTIYTLLNRSKALLKKKLRGEGYGSSDERSL